MFKKLGKFEIRQVLGRGAMGEVYLGTDPGIGREVAVKTILNSNAQGGDAKERFAREAKAAGVLNHPNLVTVYEFGEDQGVLYIAMEYVRGHDLEELLRQQALTRSELLEVLAQVCDGLDFAHRAGIVHRDIKPTNVRVQRDGRRIHAKVMDFGVARVGNSDMTGTGIVMGTVSYMAPEYIRTGKPDSRSDLFAVGVMLYEGLSGRKPFSGDTTPTILYKIVNEPPEPIDLAQLGGISPATKAVLEQALQKDPDLRFQHADELARTLRAAKDPTWSGQAEDGTVRVTPRSVGEPQIPATGPQSPVLIPQTPEAGTPVPSGGPRPSRRGLGLGLAALLLAGLGGTYLALRPKPQAAPTPVQPSGATPDPSPGAPGRPAAGPRDKSLSAAGTPDPAQAGEGVSGLTPSKERRVGGGEIPKPQPAPPPVPQPEPKPEPKPSSEGRVIDQAQRFEPRNLEKLQVHERTNLGALSLSESIQLVEKDPARAIQGLRQSLKADPTNPNAYAWLAVVHYEQGQYAEFAQVLREARRAGVLQQMTRNVRFLSIYRRAKFNQQLPTDLGD